MQIHYRKFFMHFKYNILHTTLVLVCWCVMFLFGVYIASHVNSHNLLLMRTMFESRMSIVSLMCVVLIPFLFSLVAFRLNKFFLLILVVCIKAYAFGFMSCLVYALFFQAGWLMRWLLIFADSVLVIPQLYFWLRNTLSPDPSYVKGRALFLLLSCIAVGTDYFLVSPLAVSLLKCSM